MTIGIRSAWHFFSRMALIKIPILFLLAFGGVSHELSLAHQARSGLIALMYAGLALGAALIAVLAVASCFQAAIVYLLIAPLFSRLRAGPISNFLVVFSAVFAGTSMSYLELSLLSSEAFQMAAHFVKLSMISSLAASLYLIFRHSPVLSTSTIRCGAVTPILNGLLVSVAVSLLTYAAAVYGSGTTADVSHDTVVRRNQSLISSKTEVHRALLREALLYRGAGHFDSVAIEINPWSKVPLTVDTVLHSRIIPDTHSLSIDFTDALGYGPSDSPVIGSVNSKGSISIMVCPDDNSDTCFLATLCIWDYLLVKDKPPQLSYSWLSGGSISPSKIVIRCDAIIARPRSLSTVAP